MPDVTKDDVLSVLKRITAPDGRGNLVSAGLVSDIVISSGNVMFALNADPQHLKTMEVLRGVVEKAVAAIPGVDILWVGHFDLSTSMGIPGQFQHPDFLAALKRVVESANKHGKKLGIQPGTPEYLDQWMNLGFNVISWNVDSAVYRAALEAGIRLVRDRAGRG